jgi:hypothetical protein
VRHGAQGYTIRRIVTRHRRGSWAGSGD